MFYRRTCVPKINFLVQGFQKLEHNTQTGRQSGGRDWKHYYAAFACGKETQSTESRYLAWGIINEYRIGRVELCSPDDAERTNKTARQWSVTLRVVFNNRTANFMIACRLWSSDTRRTGHCGRLLAENKVFSAVRDGKNGTVTESNSQETETTTNLSIDRQFVKIWKIGNFEKLCVKFILKL